MEKHKKRGGAWEEKGSRDEDTCRVHTAGQVPGPWRKVSKGS